jgi:opacity protein-like surface antigen
MNRKYIACAVLAALFANPALAEEKVGWVYNGLTGVASIDEDGLSDQGLGSNSSIGYRWGSFGVEVGYVNFGKFKDSLLVNGSDVRVDAKVDGFNAGINFNHDLGHQWSLQARAGVFDWSADGHVADGSSSLAYDDSGNDWYAGASVDYSWSKRSSIGLGYSHFTLEDTSVGLWGMHSEFRF